MKKLFLLIIFLAAAVVWPHSASAETLMVAVDNVTVHDEPNLYSDVRFQLYRGMEISPDDRLLNGSRSWLRFDVRGHKYWVVERPDDSNNNSIDNATDNATAPYLSGRVKFDACVFGDKKIVVNKKLRTLSVLVKNDNGTLELRKSYSIGLGKGSGLRILTREITRPFAYLILKGNKKYELIENKNEGLDFAVSKATGGEAVIALDKAAHTLALYRLVKGRLDSNEPPTYAYEEKIVVGDYVVEFTDGKFDIIINKDTLPKSKRFDRHTPEGTYYVARINPASRFGCDPDTHRSLPSFYLSYPNAFDAWDGLRYGMISLADYNRITSAISQMRLPPQDTAMGNLIMIHGGGDDDWTAGCIALEDEDMKELLDTVALHTCVEIK
ncbi:MAG: L,D-transpeptidase family protein [Nitrospirae bacterium]|nr:L,D-transpeptidase family protein [Nitrospirota bacterium]